MVAGEQQVVAVVDPDAELAVEIGAAAPAGVLGAPRRA